MATAIDERIQNVTVIEDSHGILRKGLGRLHLLAYPMDIQSIEDWEAILVRRCVAYALVQCEVFVYNSYRRGYCIFTRDAVEVVWKNLMTA